MSVLGKVKGWERPAVKEIRKTIKQKKVFDSGNLMQSVEAKAAQAGESTYKGTLSYLFYGIFPEMGVGRGVSREDVAIQKAIGGKRRPKRWTKEVAHQGHIFGELVAGALADQALEEIAKPLGKGKTKRIGLPW